jgi:hypothetical protein
LRFLIPNAETASLVAAAVPAGELAAKLRAGAYPSLADDAVRKARV